MRNVSVLFFDGCLEHSRTELWQAKAASVASWSLGLHLAFGLPQDPEVMRRLQVWSKDGPVPNFSEPATAGASEVQTGAVWGARGRGPQGDLLCFRCRCQHRKCRSSGGGGDGTGGLRTEGPRLAGLAGTLVLSRV